MLRPLPLSLLLATTVLQLAACGDDHGAQDESATSVSRDSSLAHDLQLASGDTAPYTEAADVAVANRTGTVPPMVDAHGTDGVRPAANARGNTVTESPGSIAPSSSTPNGAAASSSVNPASGSSASTAASPSGDSYIGASCASPALPDQRRCLLAYLARSDVNLDRTYQALITRLESESPSKSNGEPVTVQRLRTAQRQWLVYRDDECRRRNEGKEGPLWAPTRAQCLAEYSEQRTKELANALATRPPAPPPTKASAPTKSSKSKSSSRKHGRTRHHRR